MTDPSFLPNIEATITNGRFVVNPGMWISILHEDIAVVYFDCKSKRPWYSHSGDEIALCPDENSSNLDEDSDDEFTYIRLHMPPDWEIYMVEAARYTVRAILMRKNLTDVYKETN